LVDWVKEQTEAEAEYRRARETRVDKFVLAERIGGLVLGAAVALFGLGIAAYVGLNGQPQVAMVLGGGTLVSIVAVLVTGRHPKRPPTQAPEEPSRGKK
jgi:hypothetical protein